MIDDRPTIDELQKIHIAKSEDRIWVEVFMHVNQSGDRAEPFMVEWYPDKSVCSYSREVGILNTRVINPDVLDDEKQTQYAIFAAIVGKLSLLDC